MGYFLCDSSGTLLKGRFSLTQLRLGKGKKRPGNKHFSVLESELNGDTLNNIVVGHQGVRGRTDDEDDDGEQGNSLDRNLNA